MYIFSAKATGPGGTSDYGVSAPTIYTTPTALGMLEAVKAEAAKVVLKGHDAPAFGRTAGSSSCRPTVERRGSMRT